MQTKRVRVAVHHPIEKRLFLIQDRSDADTVEAVPPHATDRVRRIRQAAERYAAELGAIFKEAEDNVDMGRAIASIDALKHQRSVACDAVLLPFAFRMEQVNTISPGKDGRDAQ